MLLAHGVSIGFGSGACFGSHGNRMLDQAREACGPFAEGRLSLPDIAQLMQPAAYRIGRILRRCSVGAGYSIAEQSSTLHGSQTAPEASLFQ
jgi:hypothetical protein